MHRIEVQKAQGGTGGRQDHGMSGPLTACQLDRLFDMRTRLILGARAATFPYELRFGALD